MPHSYRSTNQSFPEKDGWVTVAVISMAIIISFASIAQLNATQRMVIGEEYTNWE